MRAFSVCFECPDREVGCHGRCAKYQEEVAVHRKELERIAQLKVTANDTWQQHARMMRRNTPVFHQHHELQKSLREG